MRDKCAGSATFTKDNATSGEGNAAATAKFEVEINIIFAASWQINCFNVELSQPLAEYRGGKMPGYGADL